MTAVAGEILGGKYRLDRVAGQGAMGVVFAATHLELGQQVAVKLLLPTAIANSEIVERFVREAHIAARLQSPHVAKVHDVGKAADGAPYLVMEYLRGRDLKSVVEKLGPQPLSDVIRWVTEACEALREAHELGVVHREIKPANLMLAELPTGRSIVKVVDFGISKLSAPGGVDLTQTSTAMGSPLYMAPEQMRSTKRVDVWALGIGLYELATAKTPFNGSTILEVLKPGTRCSAQRRVALRAELCMQCGSFDRSQRSLSASVRTYPIPAEGPQARPACDSPRDYVRAATIDFHAEQR